MQDNWKYLASILNAVENLQTRFDGAYLSADEVARLLDSGLNLTDLLKYANAAASNRMH